MKCTDYSLFTVLLRAILNSSLLHFWGILETCLSYLQNAPCIFVIFHIKANGPIWRGFFEDLGWLWLKGQYRHDQSRLSTGHGIRHWKLLTHLCSSNGNMTLLCRVLFSVTELTLTLLNAIECTNSKKLLQIVALSRQGIFARLKHPVAFRFCYVIAEFPIAYCCIWHGSCLGTLHSVAFSRVLREYPVGVRVNLKLHVALWFHALLIVMLLSLTNRSNLPVVLPEYVYFASVAPTVRHSDGD